MSNQSDQWNKNSGYIYSDQEEEYELTPEEIEQEERRQLEKKKRIARMKREKEAYLKKVKYAKIGVCVCFLLLIICLIFSFSAKQKEKHRDNLLTSQIPSAPKKQYQAGDGDPQSAQDKMEDLTSEEREGGIVTENVGSEDAALAAGREEELSQGPNNSISNHQEDRKPGDFTEENTSSLMAIPEEVVSENICMVDLSTGEIVANRGARQRISPASMTKILTVLVAAEHVDEAKLDDTFTMTREITDYGYLNDCSSAGFAEAEQVPIRDLFYGTILPSGADAAVALATYVAGSQEAFVDMMNQKLEELGIAQTTHFTNCVGVYDDNHYSTAYDMAVIMDACQKNDFVKSVMSTKVYTTAITEQHPEGIILSNWFLRRIEDKEYGQYVLMAKTGFVVQSKNCAVSLAEKDGKKYILATGGSTSSWRCIYDHVALYKQRLSD